MSNFGVIVLIIVLLWLLRELYSVKVYRFYRPGCGWCRRSQKEWDRFKWKCNVRMIRPVDINLDNETNQDLANNFNVRSVPTVIAVYPDGSRSKHEGDRTSSGYFKWLN